MVRPNTQGNPIRPMPVKLYAMNYARLVLTWIVPLCTSTKGLRNVYDLILSQPFWGADAMLGPTNEFLAARTNRGSTQHSC